MTNCGLLAIYAAVPSKAPGRQLRLLGVLETFAPDADGWREAGMALVIAQTGLNEDTVKLARRELIAAGLIEWQPGQWKGAKSRWRLLIPGLKGGEADSPPSETEQRGGVPAAKGGESPPAKGGSRNAATSGNTKSALEPLCSKPSALPLAAARKVLAAVDPTVTDDELTMIIEKIIANGGRNPVAILRGNVADGTAAALIGAARGDATAGLPLEHRGPRSEACRAGDHRPRCGMDGCTCPCHPAGTGQPGTSGPPPVRDLCTRCGQPGHPDGSCAAGRPPPTEEPPF